MALAHKTAGPDGLIGPAELVGAIRRMGPAGPAYEVLSVLDEEEDGDPLLEILILHSGEKANYRYTHILEDPEDD